MKIVDLPEVTSVEDNQVIVVDGGGLPTSKIKVKNLNLGSSGDGGGNIIDNPDDQWVYHRNTYRGKFLGTIYTDEQKAAVADGSFDDLYIGDYWTIGNFDWIIADINYWLNTGNTNDLCDTFHLVVIPRTTLYNVNNTGQNNGGYLGTVIYKTGLTNAKNIIYTAFGENNILDHREYFSNAVSNNIVSGGTFVNSKVDLMNQIMVYGSAIQTQGIPRNITMEKQQLSLFRLRPDTVTCPEIAYWLRDIFNSSSLAGVSDAGTADTPSNGANFGIRPAFGLTGGN